MNVFLTQGHNNMKLRHTIAVLTLAFAANASATTLSGNLTADNEFSIYLSTSQNDLGTLLTSGNNWATTYSFDNISLVSGQDYYLHVIATNWDYQSHGYYVDAGFLGSFSLSDAGFRFANGTQALVTNITDWTVSPSNGTWAAPSETPVGDRSNGTSPWGYHSPIASDATWIWHESNSTQVAYFATTITAAVPEPSSYALLLAGMSLVGFAASRKKRAN